jgi:hypothetical protein
MPLTSGSVSVAEDGTATGNGFAFLLFGAKVAALDALNPSPIAVPSIGDLIGQTTIQADQAAIDRAKQQRLAILRPLAAECVQGAMWIDYFLANVNIQAVLTSAMSPGRMPASTAVGTPLSPPASNLALNVTVT